MPVIAFDYIPRPSIIDNKLTAIYYPIIPISIGSKRKVYPYKIKCILDSGSDFNLLPADIAEDLGVSVKKGQKITHIGIGNIGLTAYIHEVKLYIKDYVIKTPVHFSYDHRIPLLGRHGFFRYFKQVVFNEKKLQVELEY